MRRIAIIGGGIAGLTAAYELAQQARAGVSVEAVLFESSNRLGGIVETVREGGFTIETGPDAWLTAKPWATELATELGLASELLPSNDATRKTWLYLDKHLVAMPDGMNLIVPTNLEALTASPLFTPAAIAAYRAEPARAAELLRSIPAQDESVASFTLRHFGPEVLARIAAPLLAGIFGGDVHTLSVRAVMPALVLLERQYGSLITALQLNRDMALPLSPPTRNLHRPASLFTALSTGMGTLIDHLTAAIPPSWLRRNTAVTALTPPTPNHPQWTVSTSSSIKPASDTFDAVLLAASLDATRALLTPLDPHAAALLPTHSSSAVLVSFCFPDAARVPIPTGFGFLVPPSSPLVQPTELAFRPEGQSPAAEKPAVLPNADTLLLACTFADQKFPHRVPPNGRLLRAFFGGATANRIARCNNDEIAAIARAELTRILGGPSHTPLPAPAVTIVRRWPNSLPQYAVGHLDRITELHARLATLPGLALLGNALYGVGLPDIIRDARQAARAAATFL